ncbi:MAG TPA: ERF family protein [Dehalococcoidia bacterium]|nr:ERF family protein [Dehalococcoidia bacterium]
MITMSDSIKELATAMCTVQANLPTVTRDKTNPFFHSKYAGLDTVMPAALKVLTAHGLALVQTVGQDGNGGTTLTTLLMHESGEWLSDTQPLLLSKSDPQGQGSAITYARRYGVMAMLGLVAEEDDDANAASPAAPKQPQKPPSAPRPAPTAPEPARDYDQARPISEGQVRAIRGALGRIFGQGEAKDALGEYLWVKAVQPKACQKSETEIHLGELTMAEASALIAKLNEELSKKE